MGKRGGSGKGAGAFQRQLSGGLGRAVSAFAAGKLGPAAAAKEIPDAGGVRVLALHSRSAQVAASTPPTHRLSDSPPPKHPRNGGTGGNVFAAVAAAAERRASVEKEHSASPDLVQVEEEENEEVVDLCPGDADTQPSSPASTPSQVSARKGAKKGKEKKATKSKAKAKAKRHRLHLDESKSEGEGSPNHSAPLLMYDSTEAGESILSWLLSPLSLQDFFQERWEKEPLHIHRGSGEVYEGVFSTQELDRILRTAELDYSASIDLTQYVDGKRRTLNPPGKVYAPTVWDHYNQGCSVRMRDPAAHSNSVWRLCSLLQEAFSSFVGANVYLTPSGTQGFAPHWDDIDAFILQLEGRKLWKVYAPREPDEVLPRFSSPNFGPADLPNPPALETWLEPGDLLYLPRGWIHQGSCGTAHSLHITLSVAQRNTWADLLDKALPSALELVTASDVRFRHSLPRDYLAVMGVANEPDEASHVPKARRRFLAAYKERVQALADQLISLADAAADQAAKEFLHGALPPHLTENERACSVVGNGEHWEASEARVGGVSELEPTTAVKLLRRHILRICEEAEAVEAGAVRVYHAAANSRNFQEKEPQSFDLPAELAPGLDFLLQAYPDYAPVEAITAAGLQLSQALQLAEELYARALLITEEPLQPTYD